MRELVKATTGFTDYFSLVDSTTGLGKTGLVFGDITASFTRTRAARAAITPITLASASAAWASGGFIEVDATNQPGLYRLDIPDAAFATGVDKVIVSIKATGVKTEHKEFYLIAWDKQIASIPNAAHSAANGLPTVGTGTGQVNVTGGRVDADAKYLFGTTLNEGAAGRLAGGFNTFFNVATPVLTVASVIQTGDSFARIGAAGAGLTGITGAALSTAANTAVADALLDRTDGIETGVTLRKAVRGLAGMEFGTCTGAGTSAEAYSAAGNPGTPRVVVNGDASGNRAPTLTL